MEKIFSIGKAAELAGMTAETLRHYDRIGLVHPCKTDEWTGYRYYSEQEIVRLHTIRALQCMDLSLEEIGRVLAFDDMERIAAFLAGAEQKADRKIAELYEAKDRIRRARTFYENKASRTPQTKQTERTFPARVILLSKDLSQPSVDNLWNYLRHFYAQVGEENREAFSFEDAAGVYTAAGSSRLFAVCTRWQKTEGLIRLPAGKYLCADCTEADRERVTGELLAAAEALSSPPPFSLAMVVLSGILQWNYQIQVPLGSDAPAPL